MGSRWNNNDGDSGRGPLVDPRVARSEPTDSERAFHAASVAALDAWRRYFAAHDASAAVDYADPALEAAATAAKADARAAEAAKEALAAEQNRRAVTSANARWRSAAEERDRLALALSPEERAVAGLLP